MKAFKATYSMGDIATGGFFNSIVIAHSRNNVKGLLSEQHDEDISNLMVEETDKDVSAYPHEQVLTTSFA